MAGTDGSSEFVQQSTSTERFTFTHFTGVPATGCTWLEPDGTLTAARGALCVTLCTTARDLVRVRPSDKLQARKRDASHFKQPVTGTHRRIASRAAEDVHEETGHVSRLYKRDHTEHLSASRTYSLPPVHLHTEQTDGHQRQ